MKIGVSFPGDEAAGYEAEHSLSVTAKVETGGAIHPLPRTSSLRGA
jgi:hypothetical protein